MYEKTEMTTESIKITMITVKAMRVLYNKNRNPAETPVNQKITKARTRLKVTTLLYLSHKNRARNLSTLMAVDVMVDTSRKIKLVAMFTAVA